ncbi:MAG TPA: MaoC/PaaZ C-terminal domain-containing protein, partial [Stellaceae bacterium]|nr:MaoC/PaaZ C-terminal domain-containing protein [Stellaceae bacterium]
MLDVARVMAWPFVPVTRLFAERDTMLYALGVGAGLPAEDLRFVYEKALQALPTMAAVLGSEVSWLADPRAGCAWQQVVHGEQRLTVHRPLPPAGSVTLRSRVEGISDKGEGRGAVISIAGQLSDAVTGNLLATLGTVLFLRGDGGCGSAGSVSEIGPPPPDRAPDHVLDLPTVPAQALLYRLSGDYNPIHVEDE